MVLVGTKSISMKLPGYGLRATNKVVPPKVFGGVVGHVGEPKGLVGEPLHPLGEPTRPIGSPACPNTDDESNVATIIDLDFGMNVLEKGE